MKLRRALSLSCLAGEREIRGSRGKAAGSASSEVRLSACTLSAYFSMKTFIVASIALLSDVGGVHPSCCSISRIDGMRRSESS